MKKIKYLLFIVVLAFVFYYVGGHVTTEKPVEEIKVNQVANNYAINNKLLAREVLRMTNKLIDERIQLTNVQVESPCNTEPPQTSVDIKPRYILYVMRY